MMIQRVDDFPRVTNCYLLGEPDKESEKKSGSYECYPPIGPMGEMGKVFRGKTIDVVSDLLVASLNPGQLFCKVVSSDVSAR